MLRLTWTTSQDGDLDVDQYGTLRRDGGVETLGLFSLFVDARPGPQDVTQDPAGSAARKLGGWWAHQLLAPDSRLARAPGSLLHRLSAYKANAATGRRAQAWAEQALAWMREAGIADRVEASSTVAGGRLDLDVRAYQGQAQVFRSVWDSISAA